MNKLSFKKVLSYLKKNQPTNNVRVVGGGNYRYFKSALSTRFIDWLLTSYNKINADLQNELETLITRSRDLSVNNELFRSYLTNMEKSVIGAEGFRLQAQIRNNIDGTLSKKLIKEIEDAWWEYGRKKNGYLDQSGIKGDRDFDIEILRTLLIDGEVFIKINRNADNPFGISFEIIDTLCIEINKNIPRGPNQNAIIMGVEVDKSYKPIRYWLREGNERNYSVGKEETIDAKDIIHIYKQQFVDQTRGFSPIVASMGSLKQLDDFNDAELIAAKISSCQGIFYERNNSSTGDFIDQQNADDEGSFLTELAPGVASVVPKGYNVKTLTPNHPNSQYGAFTKTITKRIAASVGSNYNKLDQDYESVNYSSLRQAFIDEGAETASWQRLLIENWKEIQFELWLKSYIINNPLTELKASNYDKYVKEYRFIPRRSAYYDEAKEIIATERKLALGLTSPIIEIEKEGKDPQQLINDWVKWNQMCQEANILFKYDKDNKTPLDVVQQFNDESNNPDTEN